MVILCYTIAAVTKAYVTYATLSLVVEINSIFLHTRQVFKTKRSFSKKISTIIFQLLIIGGTAKQTLVYRITSLLNVASFVMFR